MDIELFVEQLRECAPSMDALMAQGLSFDSSEKFRQGYNFIKINSDEKSGNALLDLLTRYDGTHVEIGMIRLGRPVLYSMGTWIVGQVEADPLILNPQTQEIYVEEANTGGHVLFRCAENAEGFVSAILKAACFLSRCACDDNLYEDQEVVCLQSNDCAKEAGGDKYLSFYAMLLGCDA